MMPEQQGKPPVTIDAVVKLLRDDRMRGFRIDIETDSLVEADQTQERTDRTAFVQAVGGFFKEFGPIVQQQPTMAPLAGGLLQFAVRGFKVGAELEELIEKTMAEVSEKLQNPPPPQPDPVEQAKIKQAEIKAQAEVQKSEREGKTAEMEAQFRQWEVVMEQRAKAQEAATQAQETKMDMILKLLEHSQTVREHQLNAEQTERNHEINLETMEHKAKEAKKPGVKK